jgi:hypothetical protein
MSSQLNAARKERTAVQHTLKLDIGEEGEALLTARSQQGGRRKVEGELQAHVRRRKHRGGGGKNRDRGRDIRVSVCSRCGAQQRDTNDE